VKDNNEVLIPGDSALIGAEALDSWANPDETPRHNVAVSSLNMTQYEITNNEFAAIINAQLRPDKTATLTDKVTSATDTIIRYLAYKNKNLRLHSDTLYYNALPVCVANPTNFTIVLDTGRDTIRQITFQVVEATKNNPVTQVSLHGAILFCNFKSDSIYDYRLPTEAEWEWAARGGNGYWDSFYPTGRTISNYLANYRIPGVPNGISTVGRYAANAYGLYDMAGNAWEWTTDYYTADYDPATIADSTRRVMRGGSYQDDALQLRTTHRAKAVPAFMDPTVGFRIVREN
jgi:formylglycine-generating enzyme required for sulfatase activity